MKVSAYATTDLFIDLLRIINACPFAVVGNRVKLKISDNDKTAMTRHAINYSGHTNYKEDIISTLVCFLLHPQMIEDGNNHRPVFMESDSEITRFIDYTRNTALSDAQVAMNFITVLCGFLDRSLAKLVPETLSSSITIPMARSEEPHYYIMRPPPRSNAVTEHAKSIIYQQAKFHGEINIFSVLSARLIDYSKWLSIKSTIEQLGGKVRIIDVDAIARGSFTRDIGLLADDGTFILSNWVATAHARELDKLFLGTEEIDLMTSEMKKLGITNITKAPFGFSGGNVLLLHESKICILRPTFDNRADSKAEAHILGHYLSQFGYKPIVIETSPSLSESLYDLDFIACNLPKGELLIYPKAFTQKSLRELEAAFPGKLILADEETATRMGLNVVAATASNLVMPYCSNELEEKLSTAGYNIATPQKLGLSESAFYFRYGGPHCLTFSIPDNLITPSIERAFLEKSGR